MSWWRRSARRQVCDHLAGLSVFVRCPISRFSKQRFAKEGQGSYRGATGSDIYFENIMQVPIYYLPRLSVRHGTEGISRIKNILKYYILMSVVLYISNDK